MPWSVIPQIFYDLIARVVPGATILLLGYLTLLGPTKAIHTFFVEVSQKNTFKLGTYIPLFIVAYILGFILRELWVIAYKKIQKKWPSQPKENQIESAIDYHNKIRVIHGKKPLNVKKGDLPPIYIMHDQIRLFSDSEGYRLLKLRAEQRLCHALVIGVLLLAMMNVGCWITEAKLFILERVLLAIILPMVIYVFWRRSHKFGNYYEQGTCTQWLLLNFPVKPKQEE
ncbi:MAG TPA: hypothetical protein ACFYEF_11810 [Candidatus Wunengus sp. YC63]|uniref:hypothetical protein n=1 Tax=Candidatus Wunengus sp. YC63 TaxID=3367699 RepID=UPI0040290FA5